MSRTPCEICGVEHGPKQAHVFPKTRPSVVSPIATEARRQVEVVANARTRDAARLANVDNSPTTYRHRDPEKRRAYMRALMTRRRAEARARRAAGSRA